MNLKQYPLDMQVCDLLLESCKYDATLLFLQLQF